MDNFIYNQKNTNQTELNNEFYSFIGDEDFLDENNNPRIESETNKKIIAKKIYKSDGRIKFLVKIDNSGRFFNPRSPVSSIKNTKLLQTISLSQDKFKEISSKAFTLYLNFLRSRNEAWLSNAEREDF